MSIDTIWNDMKKGRVIVDRAILIEIIHSMTYAMGLEVSMDDVDEYHELCASRVQENWIELLFDLLLQPPKDYIDFEPDGWDHSIWTLLSGGAKKFPRTAFDEAVAHFPGDSPRLRAAIVLTLGSTGLTESFPYVDLYFPQIAQLTEDEVVILIEAYGEFGGEKSLERLNDVPNHFTAERMDAWYLWQAIKHSRPIIAS